MPNDVGIGRERTLGRVEELFDKMLATRDPGAPDVWGVGIGLPAPVEFSAGRPDTSVICRCGNTSCLEAIAGGAAIARDAAAAARSGRSTFLADRLTEREATTVRDVIEAAGHGDVVAVELLNRSGNLVGRMLATLVSFYNPSLVIIGGGAAAGDMFLATIRQSVYRRSLPLATRDLRVVRSSNIETTGLRGAAFVVLDELFSRARLGQWINQGSPAGQPGLSEAT